MKVVETDLDTISTLSETEINREAFILLEKVSDVYDSIDLHLNFINQDPHVEQKRKKFLSRAGYKVKTEIGLVGRKKQSLHDYWIRSNNEKEISTQEQTLLETISQEKLEKNPRIVTEIINILLAAQRLNLSNRHVSSTETEMAHIEEVTRNSQAIYPDLPILHLAAAVHDSYKFNQKGGLELGLHELTSTITGTALVEKILEKYKKELNLNPREIKLIVKLIKRAILTHGTDEFPERESDYKKGAVGTLKNIWIYAKNKKRSWTLFEKKQNKATKTIAALNYLDALTGATANSFVKYNNPATYPNAILLDSYVPYRVGIKTLGAFFEKCLFKSFQDNLEMKSGKLLRSENNPQLYQKTEEIVFIKTAIELTVHGNQKKLGQLIGDQDAQYLIQICKATAGASFNKLLTAVERKNNPDLATRERSEFDNSVKVLIQECQSVCERVLDQKKAIFAQK